MLFHVANKKKRKSSKLKPASALSLRYQFCYRGTSVLDSAVFVNADAAQRNFI